MTATFRLTLEPDDNGTVLVTSPDIDGFVTYGETEAAAIGHAHDALLTRLEGGMHLGEPLPTGGKVSIDEGAPVVRLTLLEDIKVRLWNACQEEGVTRAELARRLNWQRESVDRLFRLRHVSRVEQLEAAFFALGQRLTIGAERAA